ncbi:MAG: hypothetical protein SFU91_01595 [Chloroherpetonaceae bacterium]|nr:hypothetical protein [Chloroherpetonaceae bacterium]
MMFFLNSESFAGGGWTRKPQSVYTKLGYSFVSTNQFSTIEDVKIETAPFFLRSFDLFVEYGLIDQLTLQVNFPLLRSANFETTETASGIGDLLLELKYGLIQGDFPVAIGFGIDMPTGDSEAIGRLKDGSGGFVRLPTGDGEWNFWTRLYASHSFYPLPAYISIDVGYNFRTNGFTNQYTVGVEVGYQFFDALWLIGRFRRIALNGTPNFAKSGAIGLGEGVEFNALGVSASYAITRNFSLTADVIGGFGTLKNIYAAPSFGIGFSFEI